MNEQNDSKLIHQWKTNFYFIWKVVIQLSAQLSKLQVFHRGHFQQFFVCFVKNI